MGPPPLLPLRIEDRSCIQSRVLDHYARINVSIPEEALEFVFQPVKSGLYSWDVVEYVNDELLNRLQSCTGDTKTEEESEEGGSCRVCGASAQTPQDRAQARKSQQDRYRQTTRASAPVHRRALGGADSAAPE